jgi:CubicO group peptidase (beta-lactamase class C family)
VSPESPGRTPADLEGALDSIEAWNAHFSTAAASGPGGILASHGDLHQVVRVASLTKLTTAWAVLLAVEEGAVSLGDPVGPPGATVAHLLCHAGGLDFDTTEVLARPGTKRIYSNTGYDALAHHVETATSIPFADYLTEGVLSPLGMTSSELRGSAAKDLHSSAADMLSFVAEMRNPVLLDRSTATLARQVQFPGLAGVLPGWGRQDPCDWSFGPELRGTKSPHWTGATAGADTLGHFGGSGCMLWLDPGSGLGCVALSDRPFGEWSVRLWPIFSDRVRATGGDFLGVVGHR